MNEIWCGPAYKKHPAAKDDVHPKIMQSTILAKTMRKKKMPASTSKLRLMSCNYFKKKDSLVRKERERYRIYLKTTSRVKDNLLK